MDFFFEYIYKFYFGSSQQFRRPSEALLSINCFQKDLGDPNPLVRAWALRTMAGIRLHVIAPIVMVAVTKCARDPSVYVRKCAANALPKLYDLRLEEHTPAIEEVCLINTSVCNLLVEALFLNDQLFLFDIFYGQCWN